MPLSLQTPFDDNLCAIYFRLAADCPLEESLYDLYSTSAVRLLWRFATALLYYRFVINFFMHIYSQFFLFQWETFALSFALALGSLIESVVISIKADRHV